MGTGTNPPPKPPAPKGNASASVLVSTPASSTYQLIVESGDLTGITGHHQIHAYIEERTPAGDVIKGVPETFGIDLPSLAQKFNNDPAQWREWVAGELKAKHIRRQSVHSEVIGWSGQRFDVK